MLSDVLKRHTGEYQQGHGIAQTHEEIQKYLWFNI